MKPGCLFQRSSAGIYLTYSRGSIEEVCIFRLFKYTHLNADNVFFSFPSDNRKPEAHFTSLLEHLRYTRKKRKKNKIMRRPYLAQHHHHHHRYARACVM